MSGPTIRAVFVVAARAAAFEEHDEVARGLGEVDEELVLRAVGANGALGLELQPLAIGLGNEGLIGTAVAGVVATATAEGHQENQKKSARNVNATCERHAAPFVYGVPRKIPRFTRFSRAL